MSAYGGGLDVVLGVAAVDLSGFQYCPVKLISTGVDISDAAGEVVNGVLQNAPTAGQPAVVRIAGMTKLRAGTTISAIGVNLTAEVTTARAIPVTGTAITDNDEFIFAKSLQTAADGEYFEALITLLGVNQAYPILTIT